MAHPGIVFVRSGLHFAVKRLEDAEQEHARSPSAKTKAHIVRSGCETLFWLFALHEDFKNLIETKTNQDIFQWWQSQGVNGNIMNALRFIRNRVTHSYKYYWQVWDMQTLTWGAIDPPTQQELNSSAGRYVAQQYADYQEYVKGYSISPQLKSVATVMEDMFMRFNLANW